jgi:hypothetical protein
VRLEILTTDKMTFFWFVTPCKTLSSQIYLWVVKVAFLIFKLINEGKVQEYASC